MQIAQHFSPCQLILLHLLQGQANGESKKLFFFFFFLLPCHCVTLPVVMTKQASERVEKTIDQANDRLVCMLRRAQAAAAAAAASCPPLVKKSFALARTHTLAKRCQWATHLRALTLAQLCVWPPSSCRRRHLLRSRAKVVCLARPELSFATSVHSSQHLLPPTLQGRENGEEGGGGGRRACNESFSPLFAPLGPRLLGELLRHGHTNQGGQSYFG